MNPMLNKEKKVRALCKVLPWQVIFERRKYLLIQMAVFTAFAIMLSSCSETGLQETQKEETIRVSTRKVVAKNHQQELSLSGTVFAKREANLGAGFPGKVEKLYYPEGTYVKEGQLLAELSGEMLAQAQAEYLTLEKDYERVYRLAKNGTVSRQEYDHVKARYEASKAKYELAKKNTRIKAPFSGVIVDYLVNEGENYFLNLNLEPGYSNTSGILRLMQLDPVKIQVEINERDLGQIVPGLKAEVVIEAFPGETFTGEVSMIKPYLSTRSRTATAEILISNPDQRLKPGMSARVVIQKPKTLVNMIPLEAIYRDPETNHELLYTVENQTARRNEFTRLFNTGDMVAIEGLKEGTEVIVGGKNRVSEGSKVVIVNNGGSEK